MSVVITMLIPHIIRQFIDQLMEERLLQKSQPGYHQQDIMSIVFPSIQQLQIRSMLEHIMAEYTERLMVAHPGPYVHHQATVIYTICQQQSPDQTMYMLVQIPVFIEAQIQVLAGL